MSEINLGGATPPPAADPLPVNSVFYQVLTPAAIRGPNGEPQYQMVGPFADLQSATKHASQAPGALLTATVVLFKTPPKVLQR